VVEGAKLEGAKKKSVTEYRLDFTKCSLCGACIEACRDAAIRFTHEYNLASLDKDDYVIDLFKRLEDQIQREDALKAKGGDSSRGTAASANPAGPAASKPIENPNPANPEERRGRLPLHSRRRALWWKPSSPCAWRRRWRGH
jgi:ferredoxin